MNSSKKIETYEVIPAQMDLSGISIPAKDVLPGASAKESWGINLKNLPIQGVCTLPNSVNRAERHTYELLKICQQRVKGGDLTAIVDLLEVNPDLIANAWVRELLLRLAHSPLLRRKRGRPFGSFLVHPLIVTGLVEACLANGFTKNRGKAFSCVAEWLGLLTYDDVKRLFYQAHREERFRGVLIKFLEVARPATAEDILTLRGAETLRSGGRITRTATDPDLGPVEITFEAKP